MTNFKFSPLNTEDEELLFRAIRQLPPSRTYNCIECDSLVTFSSIEVYSRCPNCHRQAKHRSLGGGLDLQDLLLMSLQWFHIAGYELPANLTRLVDSDWDDLDSYYAPDD